MRYHARWVLPITQPPIENGTVVETDGVITYVGSRHGAPPGKDYDLGEAILLPGLINTHLDTPCAASETVSCGVIDKR
jgi:imidazolonepropionase-like amidohydrolase